ncbi:MAG: ribonuclease J [Desulfobacterales bacterium]|nr:ribonuclease J [Desulfobacterales bacterium]MDD4071024.1 ribonuclease J [Desulfobacterales bacterium]MDD4392420.1 ribonuclease J [Desulfobacterales bacterium]
MLKIIPLGGLGEIGLNMMVFEYGETLFIVDAGLMFPEDYMLGIDFVIPAMDYIIENRHKISAIVLTHAHEDHIGALPYLLREITAPVYGTPFTLGIVRQKLDEHGLFPDVELKVIHPDETLQIGEFNLEFVRVGHSIIDGVGLGIRTPLGLIVHTGDFKIGPTSIRGMLTDVERFARFGREGVLALLSDSTNVEKEGTTISDEQVGDTLAAIIRESRGRVIVALFASNISRIQQIINIARKRGSKIILTGRSIEQSTAIARELGYLQIPESMEITLDQLDRFPDENIIMITTGSQGEPMSALARMAAGNHRQIQIKANDTVILSSKFIPGNEKAIASIINKLYKRGANVIYEKISSIHVSGHAFREELKQMILLTKPRYFIPIHGEYRHLVLHTRLAQEVGIPVDRTLLAENGQVIEFDKTGCRITDSVVTGRVLIDGKGVGDVGKSVLKERHILSKDGLVVINMAFDEQTGVVVYGPEIVSRGFVFETETGHVLEGAKDVIFQLIDELPPDSENRIELIRTRIKSALRKYFNFAISRRPVILPFILEV